MTLAALRAKNLIFFEQLSTLTPRQEPTEKKQKQKTKTKKKTAHSCKAATDKGLKGSTQ